MDNEKFSMKISFETETCSWWDNSPPKTKYLRLLIESEFVGLEQLSKFWIGIEIHVKSGVSSKVQLILNTYSRRQLCHEIHETCHSVTFTVLVNSHQR